ncbi:MAG: Gfo/Idh/MocA family oxidoreductase [Kiritimatiellae bacterium]|nr:Gfo/Idh/MocA family oxidoreductase [Kiritimatiellia bacterium]
MPEQETLRGGMIGAGAWSEVQLKGWRDVQGAQIVALCDRHPDRREPVRAKFGIAQGFDDFETMLAQANLDFVDVCVRPYSHAALTRMAAQAGLPVLCQKPFCPDLPSACETVAFCKERNVRLMINENYRWQPWYRKVKELLDAGSIGTPFFAAHHYRHRAAMGNWQPGQAYMLEMPRLLTYEMGPHYLDLFRFLLGDPDSVFARHHHISPRLKGEDVHVITLNYPDRTGIIETSWSSMPIPGLDRLEKAGRAARLIIDGTEGSIALRPDGVCQLLRPDGKREWDDLHLPQSSQAAAQQHFADCLRTGAEFETSGEYTLYSMALVYACYVSAEEGRVVEAGELLGRAAAAV